GIKQGSSRVDIPETGYLIERDGYYAAEPVYFMSNGGNPYTFKNPDPDGDLTDEQLDYIHTYMNEFEQVLESDDFNDPVNGYSKYIDTDSFARWFVFQNILANIDTNVYVTKDDDTAASKLFMGPVWDFEWSIGIGWYEGARPRPADYWVWNSWYYSKLLTDSAFIERVKAIWNQYKTLIRAEITASMDRMKNTLINSQKVNFRRWDILNRRISVGGIPLGSFEAEVACDRQFFIDHMDWLDGAINSE
ncbi:MAG: CotH kinase family protein, partial [Treponema sp.]|nr:CotH kinase family protein [Treponema sp.]